MKRLLITATVAALMACASHLQAQTSQPFQFGVPFTGSDGSTYLITTNSTGQATVTRIGVDGSTNVVTVPQTPAEAMQTAMNLMARNNPANIGYYGTNGEYEARVGAAYLQNSGQAVASISLIDWGIYKGWPNAGVEAGILQGNQAGKPGTAGTYAGLDYRYPIGDVAGMAGAGGGYDNWNACGFGYVKAGLEYRQSPYLGEFLDAVYAIEPHAVSNERGLMIAAGVAYNFKSAQPMPAYIAP